MVSNVLLFLILYSVRDGLVSFDWVVSYLTNLTQITVIINIKSDSKTVDQRVPQCSILGLILFITFSNDVCNQFI